MASSGGIITVEGADQFQIVIIIDVPVIRINLLIRPVSGAASLTSNTNREYYLRTPAILHNRWECLIPGVGVFR
jgi:uncharacterized membrane protein